MKTPKILALLLFSGFMAFAQQPPSPPTPPTPATPGEPGARRAERKEKIETMKIGFLTEKLDLTPEEAQKFWPVYNQYHNKQEELRKTRKMEVREGAANLENMNDKDIEALVDNEIVFRQKELDIQKEYHKQFKSVLPIKKVAKLYRAEEMFKRELVRKIQEGRKEKSPHRHRD